MYKHGALLLSVFDAEKNSYVNYRFMDNITVRDILEILNEDIPEGINYNCDNSKSMNACLMADNNKKVISKSANHWFDMAMNY